jgi:23S rRNA (adenine2030-N6)-methyltransferase
MNYRHAYHAGNHADVLKHAILARAFVHLAKKEKPFFFLDAHAGIGVYELESGEALKTLEWQNGVGRLYGLSGEIVPLDAEAEPLLSSWRVVVAAVNPGGGPLARYPGSPDFGRRLLRAHDRILLNELHPADLHSLKSYARGDDRMRVMGEDANTVVKASLPPPERRGLVLIDPPYERDDEDRRVVKMLRVGVRRFATGVHFLWYPVTRDGLSHRIIQEVLALGIPKTWVAELRVRAPMPDGGLAGSGLILVNPPWPIENELPILLSGLCTRLAQTDGAGWRFEQLAGAG